MKKLLAATALAAATLSVSPMLAAPASAQSKTGIAVADVRVAAARSAAFTTAMTQIETTYKAQIDARDARAQTLQAELNVLVAKYNEETRKPTPNQAVVQAAGKAVQDKRAAANAEVGQLGQQVDLAVAYVEDQISVRMNDALRAAMKRLKVDLLLNPDAVLARETNVDITDAIVADLNAILPNVTIVPPAGYQPGQLVQARNQELVNAARAAQGQPAATPT
ncbi:MAG: OmpH family outer membrane protein, partial [Sphingopyxis sp.]|nr:OmpH family outer membrane protein [Sphingopyxis sp.]